MTTRIQTTLGDITARDDDAIVNAANPQMLGGGGVDGAIHRAAGPELLEACEQVPEVRPGVRCPRGEARITPGFELPARHVIHTAGPTWSGGRAGESETLASCYRACLSLAAEHDLRTIAFPSISTGVYGYPVDQAARVAVRTASEWLRASELPERVTFVCFDAATKTAYDEAVAEVGG